MFEIRHTDELAQWLDALHGLQARDGFSYGECEQGTQAKDIKAALHLERKLSE